MAVIRLNTPHAPASQAHAGLQRPWIRAKSAGRSRLGNAVEGRRICYADDQEVGERKHRPEPCECRHAEL